MIKHVWTVLCSRSSIDNASNNVSLFEVVEQINISDFPDERANVAVNFQLVSLWSRSDLNEPETGQTRTVLETAGGSRVEGDVSRIDLTEFRRFRIRAGVGAMRLDEPGLYVFLTQMREDPGDDWETVAWTPLEIRHTEE